MNGAKKSLTIVTIALIVTGTSACSGRRGASSSRSGGASVATTAKSLGLSDDSLAAVVQAAQRLDDANAPGSSADQGTRSLCRLVKPFTPPIDRGATINSASGALAMDLGLLGIAYSACGVPANTAGPFFDGAKKTFVAQNLPLVLTQVEISATSGEKQTVSIAKLYTHRSGTGVLSDLYVKSDQSERPAEVPANATMYLRVPGDGSWLAVLDSSDSPDGNSLRGAVFIVPGGLTRMTYLEKAKATGVFYLTAVSNRAATDYAFEFAQVSMYTRDDQGRITETSAATVYRKSDPPAVGGLVRRAWQYNDAGQLARVLDGPSGNVFTFKYSAPTGNLQNVTFGKPDATDAAVSLVLQYQGNRLAAYGRNEDFLRRFDYDAAGRVKTVFSEADGKTRRQANFCYQTRTGNNGLDAGYQILARQTLGHWSSASSSDETPRDTTFKTEFDGTSGKTVLTSSERPTATGQRQTFDAFGRLTEIVSARNGQWSSPEAQATMQYPSAASALANQVDSSERSGGKVTMTFDRNPFGQARKVSVNGRQTLEVLEWFDDAIPKRLTDANGNVQEISVTASSMSAKYARRFNGAMEGETVVSYKQAPDGGVRISTFSVRNYRDGSRSTSVIDDNGKVTRLEAVDNTVKRTTSDGGGFESVLSFLGLGSSRDSAQGIPGADLKSSEQSDESSQGGNNFRASYPSGDSLQAGESTFRVGNVNVTLDPYGRTKAVNGVQVANDDATSSAGSSSGSAASSGAWIPPADCPSGADSALVPGLRAIGE